MTDAALGRKDGPWRQEARQALSWAILATGFLAMYLPSYWAATTGLWNTDEHGHGPLVFLVSLWLFWRTRGEIMSARSHPCPWAGSLALMMGLGCYLAGRVFEIASLEFLSQPLVVAGVLLGLLGRGALRAAWFPVLYLLFVVPLPSSLIAAMTGPLKQWTSSVVVDALSALDYPIAHSGVVISVGAYRLLVADACSGLNSIMSLAAVGALYLYLVKRQSVLHNVLLATSILPIALAANTIRVMLLVLITYHLGDEVGQSFLHDISGFVLFMAALSLLLGFDRSVSWAMLAFGRGSAPTGRPIEQAMHGERRGSGMQRYH